MKNILILLSVLFFVACQNPVSTPKPDTKTDTTTSTSNTNTTTTSSDTTTSESSLPVYVPPSISGTKTVNVLRAPSGKSISKSIVSRGAMAQSDPLIGQCTVPGSVYIFYDDNALVQYVPKDGTYTQFSLAAKGDVERHNYQYPNSQWDIVTVSMPGLVYDMSHDPVCPVLTIQFRNNDGTLAEHPKVSGYFYNNTFSKAEYDKYVGSNGVPKAIILGDFTDWGGNDGHSVIHIQLGGDGDLIPSSSYHP